MFGWLFGGKKELEKLRHMMKSSFGSVKKDINSLSQWIKHLNNQDSRQETVLAELKDRIASIESELENVKNVISLFDNKVNKRLFRTTKQVSDKQTAVGGVQTPIQTAVQTADFTNFSVTERAIIYILLNTDMKLGYDDLAAMLGKDRSTVRGHINRIKQKSEDLIEEVIEANGKKRLFIADEAKNRLLKKVKVRVKKPVKREKGRK